MTTTQTLEPRPASRIHLRSPEEPEDDALSMQDGENGDGDEPGLADVVRPDVTPANLKERVDQERKVATEVNELFEGLDYTTERFRCQLYRLKPTHDDEGTDITGHCYAASEPLPETDVAAMFGGGTYRWMVHGPDPRRGNKTGLLKNVQFKIAGKPKSRNKPSDSASSATLVQSALDSKDKDSQRLEEALKEQLRAKEEELRELRAAALKGGVAAGNSIADLLKHQEQQRKHDLEERRLEMQRLEAERKAELRERKDEEDRRRKEDEKREAERKADEAKKEAKREAEEAKREAERKAEMDKLLREDSRAGDRLIQVMQAQADAREAAANQMLQMQIQQSTQMMQQQQQYNQQIMALMAQKTESPVNGVVEKVMANLLVERLQGGGKDEGGGGFWANATNFVKESLPTVMREARPFLAGPPTGAPRPAQPAGQPRVAPGSVAVVDFPPVRAAIPRRPPPAVPPPPPPTPAPQANPAPAQASGDTPAPAVEVVQPFAPALPDESMDVQTMFQLLALNLEGALKEGWTTKRIWDDILLKFPESVRIVLKGLGPEQIKQEVAQHAPPDATLNSPRGHKLIADLDRYLQFPA